MNKKVKIKIWQKISLFLTVVFLGFGTLFVQRTKAAGPIKILSDSRHAYDTIIATINQLMGVGHIGTDFIVHSTNMGLTGPFSSNAAAALNTTATYYDQNGAAVSSAAPYQLFTQASTGLTGDNSAATYNLGVSNDLAHNWGWTGLFMNGNRKPPAFYMAPGSVPLLSTGAGTEWQPDCSELNHCSSLSDIVAANAGMMAVLRFNHPAWNWFDVKAALRQSGTNWNAGYNGNLAGFGTTTYAAANALTSSQLQLQPPVANQSTANGVIKFDIYPFRQTRRVKDVLFKFSSAPVFNANELTLAQIQALGGTKVNEYTSASSTTLTPVPAAAGIANAYFAWFTADNANDSLANFSRIDTYIASAATTDVNGIAGPFSQAAVSAGGSFSSIPVGGSYSVSLDAINNKLYASYGNQIARFDSGAASTTFGANLQTFGSTTAGAGAGQFGGGNGPFAIDLGRNKLFTVDFNNNRIVITDSGSGGTTFGANWQTYGTLGSAIGTFSGPSDIALDMANNKAYVADFNNNRIVRFDSGAGATTLGANWQAFGTLGSGIGQLNGPGGVYFDSTNNKLIVADSNNNRIVRFDSGTGTTTLGANWQAFGTLGSGSNQFSTPFAITVDPTNNKVYVPDQVNNRIAKFDSGGGGTTFGANWETIGGYGLGDHEFVNPNYMAVDTAAHGSALYIADGSTNNRLIRIVPPAQLATTTSATITNQVIDCSTAKKILGVFVPQGITGVKLDNVTIMNCGGNALQLKNSLAEAKNILFVNNANAVQDEAGGYTSSTSFNDTTNGNAKIATNGQPNYDSPVIDAGSAVADRTTDAAGNPIYGTPDIGAYEYQPPHVTDTDKIDIGAGARIYGDGKFRDLNNTNSKMASLKVTPNGGIFTQIASPIPAFLDISNITNWTSAHKTWTESNAQSSTMQTDHTVGDLNAGKWYNVAIDSLSAGKRIAGIGGTTCQTVGSNYACKADANGKIYFTYTGGYSTHVFDITMGDNTAPVISNVTDGATYYTTQSPTFDKGTATLNGNPYNSGDSVSAIGSYALVVTDAFGNATTVNFTIAQQAVEHTKREAHHKNLSPKQKFTKKFKTAKKWFQKQGVAFSRNLSLGSTGQDVGMLQKTLQKMGLLKISQTTYGVYKSLTQEAVTKLQQLKGISATGSFGWLARGLFL